MTFFPYSRYILNIKGKNKNLTWAGCKTGWPTLGPAGGEGRNPRCTWVHSHPMLIGQTVLHPRPCKILLTYMEIRKNREHIEIIQQRLFFR